MYDVAIIGAGFDATPGTLKASLNVRGNGGVYAVVSCKTASDIPKDKIFEIMEALKNVCVNAPVSIDDVLVENVANTGVNVIATKNVESKFS